MPKQKTAAIAWEPINYCLRLMGLFAALFLSWAVFLPIQSASIAEGVVVLDSNRKLVQHLEGGIIDQILVKEGQLVKKDQILLYLHDVKAKSEQQALKYRLWTAQLQKERLLAEKAAKKALNAEGFLASLEEVSASDRVKLEEIIANQIKVFEYGQEKRLKYIETLKSKQKEALAKSSSFQKELQIIEPLVKEDNLPQVRLLSLRRSILELDYEASAAALQITTYQNDYLEALHREIKETELEISSLTNQLASLKDIVKRSAVAAPVSGKIMNIKYHTIGAVVVPGAEIMSIVPQDEELILEVKIKPQDIDKVVIGLKAKVALTAYKGKKVPRLSAEVINVSPDIVPGELGREAYFLARVEVNKAEIARLKSRVELYPGMPAQIFIINGSRSLVSYLFTPIMDAVYKAFREE